MKSLRISIVALATLLIITACGSKKPTPQGDTVDPHAVVSALQSAYGDDYIPSMPIDETTLESVMAVPVVDIATYAGEMPLMSTHVDMILAIEAKPGRADTIETALRAYHTKVTTELLNYPMNQAKVEASEVIRHGDYVFFIMLGAIDERDDVSEAEALTFAKEQNQIGIDVINSFFK